MSKEQIQELMMGAALVALGYALYTHFKKPGGVTTTPKTTPAPYSPLTTMGTVQTSPYNSASVAGFMKLSEMLTGTTVDVGAYQGQQYLATPDDPYNNGGNDSIVLPGALW